MKDFKKILVAPNSTIGHALNVIDKGSVKIALVADGDHRLLGTLTDGDIRRAMLIGMGLEDSIEPVYCRTPIICMTNDSNEKILQLAIAHKLYQIPMLDADSRIMGIVEMDELLKLHRRPNKVVIMAGGLGTRLSPLTDNSPKPMLPIGNKPILETIIENFSKYGYYNFILSVSYKSHIIEEYFGDGSAFGVKILYAHEAKRLGTAGALGLMREELMEPFFVMNGDILSNVNFEHMLDYHLLNDSDATMGVREYDFQVPYGVVETKNGQIKSIVEKPIHKFFVSAGIYLLDSKVLSFVPKDEFFDMPNLFQKLISNGFKATPFPIREYWIDIGRISDYHKANEDFSGFFE